MKKTTAIFLLIISLLHMPGFHELLKINVLVAHYHETKANSNCTSFCQFLVMHYITDDLNNKDNDRDEQLPFKSTPKKHCRKPGFLYLSHMCNIVNTAIL